MPPPRTNFRQRKLSTRISLHVIREKELEILENDQQATPKFETGVEKHEETEHHLQAAIASQAAAVGGKATQIYIPTPETVTSSISLKQLYQTKFSQPATLIRFSSTVEDCCGVPYNLTDEDDVFLKELNEKIAQKRLSSGPCSEDQFEVVMNFFEETIKTQQPFSNVGDPPPILTFAEMEGFYDENIDEASRAFAKDIYEYWKAQRSKNGNTAIQPGLKLKIMESATDGDDNDPYVCFRRREVRQIRKTRGRDAQSIEKLKKLRLELESARTLIQLVKAREVAKKDHLVAERRLFEQRTDFRKLKRGLPDPHKDGDEDVLINQKPPKRRPMVEVPQRPIISQHRQPILRPDGKSPEQELVQLEDLHLRREQEIAKEIAVKKIQHQKWNVDHVDWTNAPLTPPPSATDNSGFRYARTEYLPTPPASLSEDETDQAHLRDNSFTIRYSSASSESPTKNHQSYRRRVGRGGRMMIDRRGLTVRNKADLDPRVAERFKFDDEDDDDLQDNGLYWSDPWDLNNMRYRAAVCASASAHTMSRQAKPPTEQNPSTSSANPTSNSTNRQTSITDG